MIKIVYTDDMECVKALLAVNEKAAISLIDVDVVNYNKLLRGAQQLHVANKLELRTEDGRFYIKGVGIDIEVFNVSR